MAQQQRLSTLGPISPSRTCGLTNWRQAQTGDFADRRNSGQKLSEGQSELSELGLAVSAFLDTAELRAQRGVPIRWHSGWALWMATRT